MEGTEPSVVAACGVVLSSSDNKRKNTGDNRKYRKRVSRMLLVHLDLHGKKPESIWLCESRVQGELGARDRRKLLEHKQ